MTSLRPTALAVYAVTAAALLLACRGSEEPAAEITPASTPAVSEASSTHEAEESVLFPDRERKVHHPLPQRFTVPDRDAGPALQGF